MGEGETGSTVPAAAPAPMSPEEQINAWELGVQVSMLQLRSFKDMHHMFQQEEAARLAAEARVRELETFQSEATMLFKSLATEVNVLRGESRDLRERADSMAADLTHKGKEIKDLELQLGDARKEMQAMRDTAESNKAAAFAATCKVAADLETHKTDWGGDISTRVMDLEARTKQLVDKAADRPTFAEEAALREQTKGEVLASMEEGLTADRSVLAEHQDLLQKLLTSTVDLDSRATALKTEATGFEARTQGEFAALSRAADDRAASAGTRMEHLQRELKLADRRQEESEQAHQGLEARFQQARQTLAEASERIEENTAALGRTNKHISEEVELEIRKLLARMGSAEHAAKESQDVLEGKIRFQNTRSDELKAGAGEISARLQLLETKVEDELKVVHKSIQAVSRSNTVDNAIAVGRAYANGQNL